MGGGWIIRRLAEAVDLDVMVDRVFIEYQCYQGPRASGSQTIDLLRAAKIHTGRDNLPPIDPLTSPLIGPRRNSDNQSFPQTNLPTFKTSPKYIQLDF